ncbi:hypothetical protein BGX21_008744 [Mortierella sp. AD011]|nr:hypothetical protein BGX21_008744 [Mortierella sp. AD011]
MCRPLELKERRGTHNSSGCRNSSKTRHQQEVDEMTVGCTFHKWMYRSDECVFKHLSVSNTSSEGTLVSSQSDTSVAPATSAKLSTTLTEEEKALRSDTIADAAEIWEGHSVEAALEESSHYIISKHDAH